MAEAESGWDFTSRFAHRCEDFCPVDLNSNLYVYESLLAEITDKAEGMIWRSRANRRKQLITDLCWDEERGAFFDYDYKNGVRSQMLSAATFHPLWAGIATERQAAAVAKSALPRLEARNGIVPCAQLDDRFPCQWEAPNLWPCLQYIAYKGLENYGIVEAALRLASKYVQAVCSGFETTGDLWEKYNAEDGSMKSCDEPGYTAPAMMGWTAGVFVDAASFLGFQR
jgi:alpha,alpha-trehalase